jgi:hypothetical protein
LEGEQIEILVELSGYEYLFTDQFGEFETVLLLSAGTYSVTARFEGNSNYYSFEKTIEVEIHKTTTTLNVESICNQTFGAETTFGFYLLDVLDNPIQTSVIIKLDGVYYATVNTDVFGYGEVILTSDIDAGIHNLTIEYQGDVNFYQTSSDVVLYTKYEIVIEDLVNQPESYGTDGIISGNIDDYSGNLVLVLINLGIDGQVFSVYSDINGNFLFTVDKYLPAGEYQVRIFVTETDYINSFEFSYSITRNKGFADITIDTNQFVFNEDIVIEGLLSFDSTPIAGVEIVIYVNGIEFARLTTDINGKFYILADILSIIPDTYTLQILALINDQNIAETSEDFMLEILKDVVTCIFYWGNLTVERELDMTIILQDSEDNPIQFHSLEININGTIYEFTTDALGTISLTHVLTETGVFQVAIIGSETTYYLAFQYTKELIIEPAGTRITLTPEEILYNSSIGLEIRLESEFQNPIANQPLLIQINSTIYALYTDENGSVFIDMSEYQLGYYEVEINFQGSDNYLKTTLNLIIEIKPQITQFKIDEKDNSILFYLLDSEDRALVNREIVVSYLRTNQSLIGTESYKTDENGLILFDIFSSTLLSEASLLNFTFNGDAFHDACSYMFDLSNLNIDPKKSISPAFIIEASVAILGLAGILSLRHLLRRRK